MAKHKIAIDAGHGSNTAGKRTPPFPKDVDINKDGRIDIRKGEQFKEHIANTGVAALLYNELKRRGYKLIRTGWNDADATDDPDEALSSRQNKIKTAGCDLSVSIHFNAYGDGKDFNSAKGIGIYVHSQYPGDSKHFAELVLRELIRGTTQVNRGIHEQKLSLCNTNTMKTKASILCELAFMTNEQEATELMANQAYWEECAKEIADGIDKYCGCRNNEVTDSSGVIKLYHTVALGETLKKIADKHNTTVAKLVKINKIKNPNLIYPGQKLILMEYIRYKVRNGDTLHNISLQHLGDTRRYKEIMDLNGLKNTVIYVGQILKIPVS